MIFFYPVVKIQARVFWSYVSLVLTYQLSPAPKLKPWVWSVLLSFPQPAPFGSQVPPLDLCFCPHGWYLTSCLPPGLFCWFPPGLLPLCFLLAICLPLSLENKLCDA